MWLVINEISITNENGEQEIILKKGAKFLKRPAIANLFPDSFENDGKIIETGNYSISNLTFKQKLIVLLAIRKRFYYIREEKALKDK